MYIQMKKFRKKKQIVLTAVTSLILLTAFLSVSFYLSSSRIHDGAIRETDDVKYHFDLMMETINDEYTIIENVIVDSLDTMNQNNFVSSIDALGVSSWVDHISLDQDGIITYVYPQEDFNLYENQDIFLTDDVYQQAELLNHMDSSELFYQFHETDHFVDFLTIRKAIIIEDEFYGYLSMVVSIEILEMDMESEFDPNFTTLIKNQENQILFGQNIDTSTYEQTSNIGDVEFSIIAVHTNQRIIEIYMEYFAISIIGLIFLLVGLIYIIKGINKLDRLHTKLEFLENYDEDTMVYNTNRLYKDGQDLIKLKDGFFVANVLIQNMKFIEDKFGHKIVKELLKTAVQSMVQETRKKGDIYRTSNDEFNIIIHSKEPDEVIKIIRHISSIFDSEIVYENIRARLLITIGISKYPQHGVTIEELIKNAHVAIKTHSQYDTNKFSFFESDKALKNINLSDFDQMVMNLDLELFEVHLMPIVEVETNKIAGFECLTRIYDKDNKLLPTEEIILSLERNGKIQQLDEIVFKKVLKNMNRINKEFPNQEYFLSVNSSALSLNDDYVKNVIKYYNNENIKAGQIVIELTESYQVENYDYLITLFNRLIDNGIKIAIDDFGSGYSSISYIAKFPIYAIKVDKQYVRNYDTNQFNQTLLVTLQSISKVLGCRLVAEGVDNQETLNYLKEYQCPYYQGYHFSKAVSLDDAIALINENIKDETD